MSNTDIRGLTEESVLIHVGIHIPSGSAKLDPEDLGLDRESLPKDVISLGRKKYIPREHQKTMNNFRSQASAACRKKGVQFSGAHLWALDDVHELLDRLDEIKRSFYDFKEKVLVPNYDRWVENWANQHPSMRDVLLKAAKPLADIESFMQMDYTVFRVGIPEGDLANGLTNAFGGIADQLYREVSEDVRKYVNSLKKKGVDDHHGVTQKVRSPITAARDKLHSLSFFDPNISHVVDWIDRELEQLPKSGYIRGAQFRHVMALLASLSTKDSIKMLAETGGAGPKQPVSTVTAPTGLQIKTPADRLPGFDPSAVIPPFGVTASVASPITKDDEPISSVHKPSSQEISSLPEIF